jgi:hypothetical protein
MNVIDTPAPNDTGTQAIEDRTPELGVLDEPETSEVSEDEKRRRDAASAAPS